MELGRFKLRFAVFLFLGAWASGCATARPQHNERLGLLEQISKADHSRRSNRFARADRSPAARTLAPVRGAVAVALNSMRWPLDDVQVTSPFGSRGHEFHEGIDLRAKSGTTVYAAQEGTVIYAGGKIRGYGRMVVIRHFKQVSTIYAHNSQLLVRTGQYVRQGQKIAISGNSGHSHGPHLHFEIRDGLSALNPIEILPRKQSAQKLAAQHGENQG